jgi:hypothetical protein
VRKVIAAAIAVCAVVSGVRAAGFGAVAKGQPRDPAQTPVSVPGSMALSSLMALSDAHLSKMADMLRALAATEAAHSGWTRIEPLLRDISKNTVPALNWFALPDGSYWSIQEGRESGNLSTRSYFPRVLAGESLIGELVVSKATNEPVAIVAVPVFGQDGEVAGVLGASVYLDRLSERIRTQMDIHPPYIFFSFDSTGLVGLNWDPELIFLHPLEWNEPDVPRAFSQMLEADHGVVRYRFRGEGRTVLFRKSTVTGWWYAFGVREQ